MIRTTFEQSTPEQLAATEWRFEPCPLSEGFYYLDVEDYQLCVFEQCFPWKEPMIWWEWSVQRNGVDLHRAENVLSGVGKPTTQEQARVEALRWLKLFLVNNKDQNQ